jgi:hypothetical protein
MIATAAVAGHPRLHAECRAKRSYFEGVVGDKDDAFSEGLMRMLREHRLLMGRPSDRYGIAPLKIMREIG